MANVIPPYQGLQAEELKGHLAPQRSPLLNLCMNLTSDFNKAQLIRASNAFLARAVWLIGTRKLDCRGAVGMQFLEKVWECSSLDEAAAVLEAEDYVLFAIDNQPEQHPRSIHQVELPLRSAFLYGEERLGLSAGAVARCGGGMLCIPQRGAIASLNVAQAAAVAMAEYNRQHPLKQSNGDT